MEVNTGVPIDKFLTNRGRAVMMKTEEMRQCLCCGGILNYIYGVWMQCRRCSRWERGW